jgi:hypothetical protein
VPGTEVSNIRCTKEKPPEDGLSIQADAADQAAINTGFDFRR